MELGRGLQIVKHWLWFIVLGTILGIALGFWIASQTQQVYEASTSLLVTRGLTETDTADTTSSEYLARTYKELLIQRPVIEAAATTLGLDPNELQEQVRVELVPETALIELTVEDADPARAVAIANELVNAFVVQEAAGIRPRDLVVVAPAGIPPEASSGEAVYLVLGGFAGFLLAIGFVFMNAYLDHSLRTVADIQRVLNLPTLGAIPRQPRRRQGTELVAVNDPESLAAEGYHALYANLEVVAGGGSFLVLVVGGAEPGVGASTLVANLGAVLAQAGHRVVLIDADLRQPTLHTLFGQSNVTGLTDLLSGRVQSIGECTTMTRVHNLSLLTTGPIPRYPPGLFSARWLDSVFDQLRETAEWVLVDAPSASVFADAALLASRADGVLLVVAAKQTSHEAARQACNVLDGAGAKMLGVVLTRIEVGGQTRRAFARLKRSERAAVKAEHGKATTHLQADPVLSRGEQHSMGTLPENGAIEGF